MRKVYKNIIWCGIAIVLVFAPLARGAVRLWSITAVEIGIVILSFIWLVKFVNSGKEFRRTAIDLPIWLFVCVAIVSAVAGIYKYASILELVRLLTAVAMFYLVVNNFSRRLAVRIVSLIIVMGTSMSILGLAQYFLGLGHSWWVPDKFLAATYVNHNHFAGYLELCIPLAIGFFLSIKKDDIGSVFNFRFVRFLLVCCILVMALAMVFSQSRGAWLSLTISLIVMNILLIKRRLLMPKSVYISFFLIAIAVAYVYGGYDDVSERLRSVEEISEEASLAVRAKIWRGSLSMIKDNPVIGTGIGTFVWGFPVYRPEGMAVQANYAHNDYLHIAVEMGVLAVALMLWIGSAVLKAGFRKTNVDFELIDGIILGCSVGILSLALHGLVDFNFHIPANMLTASCIAGIIMRRRC